MGSSQIFAENESEIGFKFRVFAVRAGMWMNRINDVQNMSRRHDKINKVTVRPAKTQISLGIRPVWSESSLSAWRKLGPLATH